MKGFIKSVVFNTFAIWLGSQIIPGLVMANRWQTFLLAGFSLGLLNFFIKPILKILFLPINFLTFGLFSWFTNVVIVYALTILVPEMRIISWTFPGINYQGFIIPNIEISYFFSLISVTLFLSLVVSILNNISED